MLWERAIISKATEREFISSARFPGMYWSCLIFQAGHLQAIMQSLRVSHTVTLLSCSLVLVCPGGPLGDSVERISVWDHPKLKELGHAMRVKISSHLRAACLSTDSSSFSFGSRS